MKSLKYLSLKSYLSTLDTLSIPAKSLLSADLTEMLVLLAVKSLLIPMEVGEVTEEVLSQEKTLLKSIDQLLMLPDG